LRAVLLLAALGFAATSGASEWIAVTTTPEGDAHFYDGDKLHIEDSAVIYWRKVEFRMPLPVHSALANLGLSREQIDCANRSLRTLGHLYYASDGRIIEDVYAPDAPAVAIAEGTPAHRLEELLCPMVNAARAAEPPAAGGDDLDKLRQEVEALQSQVRRLRRGLEPQEAAESAR
jgi:hypothetical protein